MDLYFEEYSMIPLFVHENYLKMNFKNIREILISSESISFGDIIDKHIHGYNQEWGMLPLHAFYSSINPVYGKSLTKRIDFPSYLGQLSTRNKNLRNLCEILLHSHRNIRMNKFDFRIYTVDILYNKITNYLAREEVDKAIELLVKYDLLKSDFDNLVDIVIDGNDAFKIVSTKTKGAFTRGIKKIVRKLPYSIDDLKEATKEADEE